MPPRALLRPFFLVLLALPVAASAQAPERWEPDWYLTAGAGTAGFVPLGLEGQIPVPLAARGAGYLVVAPGVDLGLFGEYRAHVGKDVVSRALHEVLVGASVRAGPERRGLWLGFGADVGACVARWFQVTDVGENHLSVSDTSFHAALGLVWQVPGHRFRSGARLGLEGVLGLEVTVGGSSSRRGSDYEAGSGIFRPGLFLRWRPSSAFDYPPLPPS